jgi:hypothetical protein
MFIIYDKGPKASRVCSSYDPTALVLHNKPFKKSDQAKANIEKLVVA